MADPIDVLDRTFAQTRQIVRAVRADQLDGTTNCPDWDVRALLGHAIGVIGMVTSALTGVPAELPAEDADLAGLVAAYDDAAAVAMAAWRDPGVLEREVDTPFGRSPGIRLARLNQADTVVHGWDIARATGQPTAGFDPELADAALAFMHEMMRPEFRGGQAFGPEVDVAAGAPVYDRLAGFAGRTP
jgi:uncharacterized protein (TIGR03086 family)